MLVARGAEVVAHDPYVREADWQRALGNDVEVPLTADLWEALNGADCAALVTRHREYLALDLQRIKDIMGTSLLVDGRNTYDAEVCRVAGVIYRGMGKG